MDEATRTLIRQWVDWRCHRYVLYTTERGFEVYVDGDCV